MVLENLSCARKLRFFCLLLLVLSVGSCSIFVPLVNAEKCPKDFIASCTGNTLTTCQSGFLHREDCGALVCNPISASCEGCGDGATRAPEECDDGNETNTDACKNDCTNNVCGDGVELTNTEECDDGNQTPGDGCENDCKRTPPPGCGDNIVQAPEVCDGSDLNGESCITQGFDSGALTCNGACDSFVTGACVDDICGDGTTTGPEECDDGNTNANDGCSSACLLEADEFVFCGAATNGDGQLDNPFNSLSAAVGSGGTTNGDVVMVLPQSTAPCGSFTTAKNITIQGLADPGAANLPALPIIDGGAGVAVTITGGTVFLQDLVIRAANNAGQTIVTQNVSSVAILRADVLNAGTVANTSFAIACGGGVGSRMLIDQSVVHDSLGGGVQVAVDCEAIAANSLFKNNGAAAAFRGGFQVTDNGDADIVLSTFDDNQDNGNGSALDGFNNTLTGRADSCIFTNHPATQIEASYGVTFSDTFGFAFAGNGNINADPLFVTVGGQGLHLSSTSPARDAANPAELNLIFDPFAIFGVDIYDHDFNGKARPSGAGRDMGMFEDF